MLAYARTKPEIECHCLIGGQYLYLLFLCELSGFIVAVLVDCKHIYGALQPADTNYYRNSKFKTVFRELSFISFEMPKPRVVGFFTWKVRHA
jgi:hypothetical protein